MPEAAFDTRACARRIEKGGVAEAPAEAHAGALRAALDESTAAEADAAPSCAPTAASDAGSPFHGGGSGTIARRSRAAATEGVSIAPPQDGGASPPARPIPARPAGRPKKTR